MSGKTTHTHDWQALGRRYQTCRICGQTQRAGDARSEEQRRNRVVKGWAFRNLSDAEVEAIRSYLAGGPVPAGYETLDEVVR